MENDQHETLEDFAVCSVRGRGYLRHRFWGDYSARIGIVFDDNASAQDARQILGERWQLIDLEAGKAGLAITVDSEGLDALKLALAAYIKSIPCYSYGCKGALHSIDSLAHSADYSPAFDVIIPITPAEQRQLPYDSNESTDKGETDGSK